ncbi:sodium/calcium exchanger 1-like isoform X3 [Mugil cephalus]|uniref:sodium/calcium exchanger 1-like isoform X3 n=1 Tax=Mugil cephalus TaxID=48193 RepID=UPI001FB6EC01|nr:sodium/calcium exchanger 1-like isoform X3 [Mugil cephalus]
MIQARTSTLFSTDQLLFLLTVISTELPYSVAGGSVPTLNSSNTFSNSSKCGGSTKCVTGVILPVWQPVNPAFTERLARATIYFVGLAYMFLGVSIIADRFMASIEVITSQERQITIKKPNGERITTTVRVWNETVSNLTLMALGSSAPEILLSVVEVCGHNFTAGELGPNTIVGSAAFNMFVIIGLCVSVIPDGETRKVKHLRVFFVTATWSVFAYTWLYLILAVFSPGVVQIWEGLLTLFFFPICVGFAYVADRRLLFYKYMSKRYRAGKQRGMIIETEGEPELPSKVDIEMDGKMLNSHGEDFMDGEVECEANELDEEEARREVARILKELKQKHPEKDMDQLMELANYQVLTQQQKSRAFYRCQATRIMTGAGNILKKHAADQARRVIQHDLCSEVSANDFSSKVFFNPGTYQCLENCGSVALNVVRRGGDLTSTVSVDYQTEDGTANAGSDYQFTKGTILFKPGETEKEIRIDIIDDDIFEEDEHFLVHLSNVKVVPEGDSSNGGEENHVDAPASLGLPCTATVTIFDDDHAGIFTFEEPVVTVSESVGVMEVKVMRTSGARGVVLVPYKTIEGTAKGGGEDFEDTHGVLEFENDEILKTVRINIIDDEQYEKNKNFFLEMGEPQLLEMSERKAVLLQEAGGFVKTGTDVYRKVQGREHPAPSTIVSITEERGEEALTKKEEEERRIAEMGRPMLGEHVKLEVVIEESYEFKSTVDKLIKKTNLALVIGTNSWREQFIEAITVSSGDDDDDDECAEEKLPSCFDYVMHFLTVFWKLLFAFVPPTDYWNGWACFVVSISVIGLLTAVIGDLASHFGCTVGLKDSVTAVVFVALGTSVPDTFASKVAAIQDQYADASIGNVTGSNAVNVFLGIGVAWSIAAIYHYFKGEEFRVDPGTLAFSVTLFTIFAFICIAVLIYRRRPEIGGELGGPRIPKILTTTLFFSLWLMYIVFSSLEAYCHVKGF